MTREDAYRRPDPEQLAARLDRIHAEYSYRIAALGDDPDAGDIERAQAEMRRAIATDEWSEWLLPFADLRYWQSEAARLREYLEDAPTRRPWLLAHGIPEHQIDFAVSAARADLQQAEAFVRRLTPKPERRKPGRPSLDAEWARGEYLRACAELWAEGARPDDASIGERLDRAPDTIEDWRKRFGLPLGRDTRPAP